MRRAPEFIDTDAARSAYVLRRFGFRVLLLSAWATLQALLGQNGFGRPFACMLLISALLCQLAALWRAERVQAPHWTSFDEAAWLLLLGGAAQRFLP